MAEKLQPLGDGGALDFGVALDIGLADGQEALQSRTIALPGSIDQALGRVRGLPPFACSDAALKLQHPCPPPNPAISCRQFD